MDIALWIHFLVFYFVPLVFKSIFVPVLCCFYCYGSVVFFKVRYYDTSRIVLFAQYTYLKTNNLFFKKENSKVKQVLSGRGHWWAGAHKKRVKEEETLYTMKLRRAPTEWEEICARCTADTGLITRTYRELKKVNSPKTNEPMKKCAVN
jgi:hypothetical protein